MSYTTVIDYKRLSQQEPREVDIENDFSLSLSSDESQDSLDKALINIGNKPRKKRRIKRKDRDIRMRLDGFDTGTESYEELLGSAKRRRQFLILGGLCFLAIIVMAAIVLAVVLINKKNDDGEGKSEIKLDDILSGALQPKRFDGTWVDDTSYYYTNSSNGDFILYDVVKKEPKIIIQQSSPLYSQFAQGMGYEFSSDKNFILMQTQFAKIFRHSFLAEWKIFDVVNNRMLNVTVGSLNDPPLYRLVKFAPSGHGLIVVHRNNIYYKENPTAAEIQLTFDGTEELNGAIMNGIPDWVYEEEIFSTNSASWFSPDGKKLAFIQFNDTHVPSMTIPIYGYPGQFQYPQTIEVNYPKSGAPNPTVKFFYIDLDGITQTNVGQRVFPVQVPSELAGEEHLITSVSWANDNTLISVWMNRVQNKAVIFKCTSGSCINAQTMQSQVGWIEFYTAPFYNENGSEMIFIGTENDYRHIKVLNLNTNSLTARTSGKFIVTEILKYIKKDDVILYTANLPTDIKAQHIFAIKNQNGASAVCLTCNLHEGYSYYSAEVSEGGNHLVIIANGPGIPRVDLYALKIDGASISLTDHVQIETNEALRNTLNDKKMPNKVYEVVKLDDDTEAYVMMIQPPYFDTSKKYPLLVDVYGGPDSSGVNNRFTVEWGTYLASSLGIVYIKIDGRGSGLRSDTHLHKLYKKLGTVEVDDQVRTVQELLKLHSYLDEEKTAIWGWSYGGYVSGMSLMRDNNVFKCATSVAPVTDWTLYDTIYTERYMVLPKDNFNAYNESRMMNFIENIPKYNKKYMLVHGTMDDNVHFQQGMVLARALERADIEFKEITYPDEDHALAHVRPHLYHSLERFFRDCFDMSN